MSIILKLSLAILLVLPTMMLNLNYSDTEGLSIGVNKAQAGKRERKRMRKQRKKMRKARRSKRRSIRQAKRRNRKEVKKCNTVECAEQANEKYADERESIQGTFNDRKAKIKERKGRIRQLKRAKRRRGRRRAWKNRKKGSEEVYDEDQNY
ncbi:MAG: hypothetical protein N4A33_05745 [Bacteriovoracaceae bacterium]|jgi:hypothetical protein|nr:hypothetical protein [Bacteriovoracaceae bacterium]